MRLQRGFSESPAAAGSTTVIQNVQGTCVGIREIWLFWENLNSGLWTPQTSLTAVETGLPVTPPALVTSPGKPAWTLSWCTVAGRQQRAPLAWAGTANRSESTEMRNSTYPASGGHTDCCSSTSLLILKHCLCFTSVCSWLHHLPCLLGTACWSFTTSE